MKIVVLDGYTTNPGDLYWDKIKSLGQLTVYDRTSPAQIVPRSIDADILIVNGVKLTSNIMKQLPRLKLVTLLATGFNNIDVEYAKAKGVAICNTPCYSTEAVAQHTIALLLEITNQVALHSAAVHAGKWYNCPDDCFCIKPLSLLAGKSIGIIGFGNIGKKVGEIAEALGMRVIPYSEDPEYAITADVVSLHCPLTPDNIGFVNEDFISKMKDGAILINTARGALIDEMALAAALNKGKLAAAGVDVMKTEPPRKDILCPLIECPNCYITPHHAWMPLETRQLLIDIAYANIISFMNGDYLNRIDL
ncbi:MAG: D-2-hydroxyacid dehydrogenase [Aminipila sp.]